MRTGNVVKTIPCELYNNDCFACLVSTIGCVYLLLSGGQGKCVTPDKRNKYTFESEVQSLGECVEVNNPDEPVITLSEQIRKWKLENYEPLVSPAFRKEDEEVTVVHLGMTVTKFTLSFRSNMDSKFHVDAMLHMEWEDDRLEWATSTTDAKPDINDLVLYYSSKEIWWPKITLRNNENPGRRSVNGNRSSVLHVNRLGFVQWRFPAELETTCQTNLLLWPFDTHICNVTLIVASRDVLDGNPIDLQLRSQISNKSFDDLSLESWIGKSDWKVKNYSSVRKEINYKTLPELQIEVDIIFSFTIERSSSTYAFHFSFPLAVMILLNFLLLLPSSQSNEYKMNRTAIHIMSMYLFWIYLDRNGPPIDLPLPIFMSVFGWNLLWVTLILITRVVIHVQSQRMPFPPPQFLRWMIPVEVRHNPALNAANMEQGDDQARGENIVRFDYEDEWEFIGFNFDRAVFSIYMGVTVMILSSELN